MGFFWRLYYSRTSCDCSNSKKQDHPKPAGTKVADWEDHYYPLLLFLTFYFLSLLFKLAYIDSKSVSLWCLECVQYTLNKFAPSIVNSLNYHHHAVFIYVAYFNPCHQVPSPSPILLIPPRQSPFYTQE
jgi:hypothetical protein